MATFTVELNDANGTPVEFGDQVRVILPEIVTEGPDETGLGWEPVFVPERTVLATVIYRLSQGLLIRIDEIETVDGDGDPKTKVGAIIPFRRTIWHWVKVNEETKRVDRDAWLDALALAEATKVPWMSMSDAALFVLEADNRMWFAILKSALSNPFPFIPQDKWSLVRHAFIFIHGVLDVGHTYTGWWDVKEAIRRAGKYSRNLKGDIVVERRAAIEVTILAEALRYLEELSHTEVMKGTQLFEMSLRVFGLLFLGSDWQERYDKNIACWIASWFNEDEFWTYSDLRQKLEENILLCLLFAHREEGAGKGVVS